MYLSTQSFYLSERKGEPTTIRILKQAGYDAIDFSMFGNLCKPDHPLSQAGYLDYARSCVRLPMMLVLFSTRPMPLFLLLNQMILLITKKSFLIFFDLLKFQLSLVHRLWLFIRFICRIRKKKKIGILIFFADYSLIALLQGLKLPWKTCGFMMRQKQRLSPLSAAREKVLQSTWMSLIVVILLPA